MILMPLVGKGMTGLLACAILRKKTALDCIKIIVFYDLMVKLHVHI